MNGPRPPKKTESLEVRLPHAVKQAFMARAREQGRTASAVLREFVEAYLAGASPSEAQPMIKRYLRPAAATTLAASALALYTLTPSAVAAAPDLKALFEKLDRNGDGALSAEEFIARHEGDTVVFRHDAPPGQGAGPFMIPLKAGVNPHAAGPLSAEARAILRTGFDDQDQDKSGAVSFGEFESHHLAMLREGFDGLDADRDGAIERSEYDAAARPPVEGPVLAAMPFDDADRNSDGRISWNEFLS